LGSSVRRRFNGDRLQCGKTEETGTLGKNNSFPSLVLVGETSLVQEKKKNMSNRFKHPLDISAHHMESVYFSDCLEQMNFVVMKITWWGEGRHMVST
jgi:hypothetical protein